MWSGKRRRRRSGRRGFVGKRPRPSGRGGGPRLRTPPLLDALDSTRIGRGVRRRSAPRPTRRRTGLRNLASSKIRSPSIARFPVRRVHRSSPHKGYAGLGANRSRNLTTSSAAGSPGSPRRAWPGTASGPWGRTEGDRRRSSPLGGGCRAVPGSPGLRRSTRQ